MERKLVSVQVVEKIEPILGADFIERVSILGWYCVAKKGEFQAGDKCCYFEIDSLLPETSWSEFMRNKHFRVKTIKLRSQISQGLALPTSILPPGTSLEIGSDITEILGVVKYEPAVSAQLAGVVKGNFPSFLHKTDEIRIQSVPKVLERHSGKSFYVTEKVDGSSMTVYYRTHESLLEGEFGVCSRNLDLKETEGNSFWKVARELNLEGKLKSLNGSYSIQGELLGPGIQRNKYKLPSLQLKVFNIFNIQQGSYLDFNELREVCHLLQLDLVPVVHESYVLQDTVDSLVEMSKGASLLSKDSQREGIIFRPLAEEQDEDLGRLSWKVISPSFLLKHDE